MGRSVKNSLWYVKVDSLGKTLLFTWSKSDKNWLRSGASNTTHSKNYFCPTFGWPEKPLLTSENNQPIKFLKEKRVDQSEHGNFVGKSSKIWASDAKCQTATLVHACWTSRHFYNRDSRFIVVTEKMNILILGRPTSLVRENRILPLPKSIQASVNCFLSSHESDDHSPVVPLTNTLVTPKASKSGHYKCI